MKLRKKAVSMALAASLAMSLMPGMPLVPASGAEASAEELGGQSEVLVQPKAADETEDEVEITEMTIADTYYSANGKYPLHVEFEGSMLTYDQRSKLTLTVSKGNSKLEPVTNEYSNYFDVPDCSELIGKEKSCSLTFTVAYDGKEICTKTKTVSFADKDVWTNKKYLETGSSSYYLNIGVATGAAITSSSGINALYLLDEDGKVAAGTEESSMSAYKSDSTSDRYSGVFRSFYEELGNCSMSGNVYRTRKLKSGEILTPAYSVQSEDGTETRIKLDEIKFTVTAQPFITSIYRNTKSFNKGNGSIFSVSGENVDLSLVTLILKDGDKEVGRSTGSVMERSKESAFFTVEWAEGYEPSSRYYDAEYISAEKKLLSEDAANKISYSVGSTFYNIVWNPKTDTIEYYFDSESLPVDTTVYCGVFDGYTYYDINKSIATGSAIVGEDHLIKAVFPNTFEREGSYTLALYSDEDFKKCIASINVYIYPNKEVEGSGEGTAPGEQYYLYDYQLKERYYLSNEEKLEFSSDIYCNDESKLLPTCSAIITVGGEEKSVELTRQSQEGMQNRYLYTGSCEPLEIGSYYLVFSPDGEHNVSQNFYVNDSETISLTGQSNDREYFGLGFGSAKMADWYLNEENQKKLSLKIYDIEKNSLGKGTFSLADGDFTMRSHENSNWVYFDFSKEMKDLLKDVYFCYMEVSYDKDKEPLQATSPLQKFYEYSRYYKQYYYYENTGSGQISLRFYFNYGTDYSYASSSWNKGKYSYNYIEGSGEGVFPITVKITKWYSLDPIKTFEVEKSGGLTKEELSGLDSDALYNVFLKGADGTVQSYEAVSSTSCCYLEAASSEPGTTPGEEDKPGTTTPGGVTPGEEDKPGTTTPGEEDKPGTTPGEEDKPGTTPGEEDKPGTTTPGEEDKPGTTPGGSTGSTGGSTSTGGNTGSTGGSTSTGGNTGGTSGTTGNVTGTGSTGNAGTTASDNSNTADGRKPEDNQQQDNTQTNNNPANTEQQGNSGNTQTPETTDNGSNTAEDNNSDDEKEETKAKGKLTLENKKITVEKGKTAKIEITSDVNTKVTYTSSDPSIATVNKNGKIIAKKKGTVTITVSANGKEKEVTVTVEPTKKASTIKLSKKMKLSDTKTSLKKGAKLTIKKAAGTGNVTYRSSNSKIATVSAKGVIKAKKKGTVTIFVENGKKTVKLKITVKG